MDQRPIKKLALFKQDLLMEGLGWAVLVFLFGYSILQYPQLPATIPTHFNLEGKPDGYGSKASILLLPVIGAVLFGGMPILNKYPHIFNYLYTVTEENAERQYRSATRLIRVMKLLVVCLFAFLQYKVIKGATSGNARIGNGIWIIMLAGLVAPMAISFWMSRKEMK